MTESTLHARTSVSAQSDTSAKPWRAIREPWVTVPWAIFLVSSALLSSALASRMAIIYTASAFVLFALPGIFVVRIFFADHPDTRTERTIIGTVFGIAISSYVAILVGFLVGWNVKAISLALIGLCCVCGLLGHRFKGSLQIPARAWTRADYSILAGIGIVLVLFSAIPSLHVGKLTSQGYAYTWLYGFDFLYRADVIQAMTTHLPPDWFWMSGIPLRMYLVGYALPAFAYTASGKVLAIHSVLLLTTLVCGFLMLSSLYVLLRNLFSEIRVLCSTLLVTLAAYSYYWVYDAAKTLLLKPGQGLFGSVSSVSHHLQRTLLVEPQAALATSLVFVLLSLLALVRFRLNNSFLAVFFGLCLAISFGMEAMQGLLIIAWFGLYFFLRIALNKPLQNEALKPFLATVVTCGIVSASFFALGMYQRSTSNLAPFAFSRWIAEFGILYFLVEFGPLFLLGVWGVIRWWRGSREEFGWPLLLLAALTILQVLFVFQKPPARMADRLLPLVLIPFVAYFFRDFWSRGLSRLAPLFASMIILLGVPTFFTDIHSASDVGNSYDTRYVRPEDMQACQWIRQNLSESAVIQGDYDYFSGPDRGLYLSLIASFAQRPQVLGWTTNAAYVVANGWPIAKERRADLDHMFDSSEASSVVRVVEKYSINYLYVGPHETERHPNFLPLLQSAPELFEQIYSRNGVAIFRFAHASSGAAPNLR